MDRSAYYTAAFKKLLELGIDPVNDGAIKIKNDRFYFRFYDGIKEASAKIVLL